jgi:hypothetical protein
MVYICALFSATKGFIKYCNSLRKVKPSEITIHPSRAVETNF